MKVETPYTSPWVAALIGDWEPPSAGAIEIASGYEGLTHLWEDTDSSSLLVWLAARLAPSKAELIAVVETARLLVHERLSFQRRSQLDVGEVFSRLTHAFPDATNPAFGLAEIRDGAAVCFGAARSVLALSEAAVHVAKAIREPKHAITSDLRKIPSFLATAVSSAEGAYATYHMMRGAPFASVRGGDELVRFRHCLEQVEEDGNWRVVARSKLIDLFSAAICSKKTGATFGCNDF